MRYLVHRLAACGLMLVLGLAGQAWGQAAPTTGVVRWPGGDLYREANFSSAAVASVPRGDKVELLARDGIWRKVRWGDKEGWMNRVVIEWLDTPAPVTPVVAGQSAALGAPAGSAPAMAPGTANSASPVAAATPSSSPKGHALVFGLSQYQSGKGIPTLAGVPKDMDSASAMAELMGISRSRVAIYRDGEVTKATMAALLTQLAKEVAPDEPVLVYYSGHGGRVQDPEVAGRCIEGLISHDGMLMTNTEMAQLLEPLARKTDRLFVFFDACHSGGLSSTRGLSQDQRFKAKFVPRGDVSNCSEIVNMLQSPPAGRRALGNRFVYAAAARADEISLDDAQNGGLATFNFLRCMAQGTDQSVDSIRACAQNGINQSLVGSTLFKPHNLTITGDLTIRPVNAVLSPAYKQQLLSTAAQGTLANRPSAAKAVYLEQALGASGWPTVREPLEAFRTVVAKAELRTEIELQTPQTLKIDTQALNITVRAPADGYIYVFQATADARSAVLLFPNIADRDNQIRADRTLALPRASWPLIAGGPAGDNQLLVVFSRSERDLGQLVGQEAGPFLDLAVSPLGMQALTLAISRSAHAEEPECKAIAARRPDYCASSYTAIVRTIREVN